MDFSISYVKLDKGATIPKKAYTTDAGLDLFSREDKIIWPKCSSIFDTGVHIQIPFGYFGAIRSKSGLMVKHGITSDGTVDSGYSGSICVKLFNNSWKPYRIHNGDKISQIVIQPYLCTSPEKVDELWESERGANGFGSSGR